MEGPVHWLPVRDISVGKRLRRLNETAVKEIAQSITEVGQLTPILVREVSVGMFALIAGWHRLEAFKRNDWKEIEAKVVCCDVDSEAELVEIDENLVRADLTVLERAEHLKRRKELYEERHPETKQHVAGANASNRAQGNESDATDILSFASGTATKTGQSARTVRREIEIATSLPDDVKDQIADTATADNKSDLLKLAKMEPEKQRKVSSLLGSGAATGLKDAQRQVRESMPAPQLPDGKYRIFYADPPWKYGDDLVDGYGPAANHYPSMTIAELCEMPVEGMAHDDAVLFLWATSPFLEDSFKVINAWGFTYKSSFVWDKVRHNYGHYNSVRHEILLVCTRGSCTPDVKELHDSVVSIERSVHSEKPKEFRELIEGLYTHGNRIELFARTESEGWSVWGNETPSMIRLSAKQRRLRSSLPDRGRIVDPYPE